MVHLGSRFRPLGVIAERLRTVRIAQDRVLGGTVVVKYAPEGTAEARFLREEGRLLADLEHPRIARLVTAFAEAHGFDDAGAVSGIATEWVDGEPVTKAVRGLGLDERITAFAEILDPVAYLHRRGLLHLDLKPVNVLRGDHGCVLLDLGSARPIDAGPGEAGGTLGYAAPEILLGDGASVAADLYSLGVLLYLLLTDLHPFGDLGGRALRDAVLAEQPPPVRAVRPDVPRALARLADDLLAREPVRRPRDVEEVAGRLAEAGFDARLTLAGAPGFAGRDHEIRALIEILLEDRAALVAVVGERGSGRARLVRHVLANAPDVEFVDLAAVPDPAAAVERFAASRPAPARCHQGAVLLLGRREDRSERDLAALDARVPGLVSAGHRLVWASTAPVADARLVPLAPLDTLAQECIARDFGRPPDALTRAVMVASGGNPAALVTALSWSPERLATLPSSLREAWDAVASLPSGVPAEVVGALPGALRSAVMKLAASGLVRLDPRGVLWHHLPDTATPGVTPAVEPAVGAYLESEGASETPWWSALVAARTGSPDVARVFLAAARRQERRSLRRCALELVWRAGDVPAGRELAELLQDVGEPEASLGVIDALPADSARTWLRARALGRLGRDDEAVPLLEAWVADDPDDGRVWTSLAWARLRLGDIGGAAAAAAGAAAARRVPVPAYDVFDLELRVAVREMHEGKVPRRRIGELMDGLQLDPATLPPLVLLGLSVGYKQCGRTADAARMLAIAARKADAEGDLGRGCDARLGHATLLLHLERSVEARPLFAEVLLLARSLRLPAMVTRALYGLAEIDISWRRFASAERHLAELASAAETLSDAQATDRVRYLRGRLAVLQGRHEEALEILEIVRTSVLVPYVANHVAEALLALGRPAEALDRLRGAPVPPSAEEARARSMLEGRALAALARERFAEALRDVPDEPLDPMLRPPVGELLLACAGEDLDPASFAERRRLLDRAAGLLRGDDAARAASLRDRLLASPGAALERIVELTEAMHDPAAFPETLARLVNEALGAHRVLIMLRIPGLGRQMTWRELSGQEAAGIGHEVLTRLQKADDVWLADDAFADPALREASATVRTFEIRSLLAVAIPREGRAVGALYVDDLHRSGRFTERDVRVLQRLGRAVGHLLGILGSLPARDQQPLADPKDVLGVLLTRPEQITQFEATLRQLRGQRETNLLVTGPTGAGKTWFARRLATDVLGLDGIVEVALRKGDLDKLVSAISGTRRGQFTGAIDQVGAVERAIHERKALFLDEIQTLDEHGQQVLLPLLELPHRRLGDLTGPAKRVNGPLHVILGTNVDVAGNAWAQHFREDLWWRMSWAHVHLPPLGERGPEVVYRYLARMLAEEGHPPPEQVMDIAALHRVTSHDWPGNLRELHRFANKAAAAWRDLRQPLGLADLAACGVGGRLVVDVDDEADALEAVEREVILNALRRTNWVQKDAAELLGISKDTMLRRVRRHGLHEEIKLQRPPPRRTRRSKKPTDLTPGTSK